MIDEYVSVLMPSMSCTQVYFDMNVDGQSQGRIVVQLFDDVPIGSRRFMDLAEGHEGISYQLSKVDAIAPVCMLSLLFLHIFFWFLFPLAASFRAHMRHVSLASIRWAANNEQGQSGSVPARFQSTA